MSKPNIAIFGASGLVGSSLCERLYFENMNSFRALIHSYASAARIARFPFEIRKADLLKFEEVQQAIEGCDCVVNCALGDGAAMLKGLGNLLRAVKLAKIKKFIHIGSIAIYGEDPSPDAESEEAPPTATNPYSLIKLQQDEMVFKLHRDGVPSIILCSGHIVGPYAPFIIGAVDCIEKGDMVLVDGGRYPTNVVQVDNLVEAILTAMRSDQGWGERYFVTESERPTWKQFYEDLRNMLGLRTEFPCVSREEVTPFLGAATGKRHFSDTLKTLVSGEFRSSLAVVPAFARMNQFAFGVFNSLSPKTQAAIRARLERPVAIEKETAGPNLSQRFVTVQVRRPHFAPRKIMQRLGYAPILTYQEGMESIHRWLDFVNCG